MILSKLFRDVLVENIWKTKKLCNGKILRKSYSTMCLISKSKVGTFFRLIRQVKDILAVFKIFLIHQPIRTSIGW